MLPVLLVGALNADWMLVALFGPLASYGGAACDAAFPVRFAPGTFSDALVLALLGPLRPWLWLGGWLAGG